MLNYGIYANSGKTTSSRATTKKVDKETVPVKGTVGPLGDTEKSAYGEEGKKGYRPPGFQFIDMLDGSSILVYASSSALFALAANTLY